MNATIFSERYKALLGAFCAALSLLFSQAANAASYTWAAPSVGGVFPTPAAACDAVKANAQLSIGNNGPVLSALTRKSDTIFDCFVYTESGYIARHYDVARSGDSCPNADDVYNGSIGICETPPPPCEVGDPGIFASGDGPVINSGGRNYVANPPIGESVCYNQCRFTVSSHATSCFTLPGDSTRGFCNYTGTGNGENCSEPDAALGKTGGALNPPTTPDVPPSDPNDPGCLDGYSWSGTTCVKTPADGGGDGGGDGDGDGDGGGTGGGGSGGGDGTGSGGDGDGTGSGGSDGGTGGGGTGDGDGSGSGGGGGGSGEGEGACDPATDPNKCTQSSVGGESCNAELACSGDAVQCATLRQEKALRCHAEKMDDFEGSKPDIETLVQGDKFHLDEGSGNIDIPSFVNKGSRFLPSTCPSDEKFSLTTAGGHSFGFSYEPLCRAATDLSPLFVAVATILAALYVGRSVGGQ